MSGNPLKSLIAKRGKSLLTAAAKDVVQRYTPHLAKQIGGPIGGLVEKEISRAITGNPDADPAEVSQRIEAGDAETMAALTEAQAKLEAAGVDLARVEAEDRANARQVHGGSFFVHVLAACIIAGFFAVLGTLMFIAPPEGMREVLIALIGLLGGAVSSVTQFFFGSSQGSKDKTAMLGGGR